jgi:histidinol-phosphate aminotransferase
MVLKPINRRGFVGGVATALGYLSVASPLDLLAQGRGRTAPDGSAQPRPRPTGEDYDALAKLANNENPYGPPPSVMDAMTHAFKYSNRYGYPNPGIVEEIAKHHGVKPENVMLGSGSGEILDVASATFLQNGKKILSAQPSYDIVFGHLLSIKAEAIGVPLTSDFRQDIPAIIKAAHRHYRSIGYVYVCSPNNPTGRIVTKQDLKQLIDNIPEDLPVLVDEAYFHFVDDPNYETAVPYVLDGRPVIVARTFSKIAALAGMRLGYAIATRDILQQMRPSSTGSLNALVQYAGVAALKDTASQAQVKKVTLDLRKKTMADLNALGYNTIPSEANFFMVHLKRPVTSVGEEFRKKGVLVGRPFPPLTEHLRVSVGTADEMSRFTTAFKEIMANPVKAATGSSH